MDSLWGFVFAIVLGLFGVAWPVGVESHAPVPSATERPRNTPVPALVGTRAADARRYLRQQGVDIITQTTVGCFPGLVVAQEPAAGTSGADVITIEVIKAPAAGTCALPAAHAALQELRAWARREGPAPAFAADVEILIGNQPALTISGAAALDPANWTTSVFYAERTPISTRSSG